MSVATEYDDAGRIIKFIENYTDGDPTTGGEDEDITVLFTYEADGQRTSITAKQKSSLDDQTTKYVYGTSLADSDVARSDFLRAVIYPDSDNAGATGIPPVLTNGASGVYDRVEHRYNRQGQVKETKDQNGTVHSFDFDQLGRQVHDRITALGIGVDGAVRRISTSYDVQGNVKGITSYDNTMVGSGTVVNEVFREYGDSGLLENEYQQLDGAKNANTPNVGYIYDESSNGGEFSKGLRLKSIRYPNGRLVHHTYGSSGSDSDNLNRLDAIKDDDSGLAGATLASFDYLGAGIVVIEDLEEPDVQLDLFGGTSGTYSGLDHFNRVVDQRWYDSGASADRDRLKYGYDAASNRTYREDTVISGQDQFYTYDGVNRLKNFDHGDLNAGKTGIGASPIHEEEWTLDPLGNWSGYTQKTNSTTGLNQVRSFNKANEITDIDESIGTSWPTPNYDKNGNMTSIPQPADLANSYDCTWDGWNRLVKVEDGTTTIASYGYDGLNRRISKNIGGTARYFFYSDGRAGNGGSPPARSARCSRWSRNSLDFSVRSSLARAVTPAS